MEKSKKVIILGAGLAGMAAAARLAEENEKSRFKKFDILLLEKNSYLGGLAASFEIDGKYIPFYYHHVFANDNTTKSYFQKLGMKNRLKWKKIKMGICANGKIYNFTDPISLLKFDFLSFSARIRYGLFGAYVFSVLNPDKIPDEMNAGQWLEKYAGKEVANKLFYNLYARNKFNIPLESISAKQFANRLKAKEAIGKFAYPNTGLQSFIDAFENYLVSKGVKILKNIDISAIDLKEKKVSFEKKQEDYDILISTMPLPVFSALSSGLPDNFKQKISRIKYCPCVCVAFGTESFLSRHYWLNLIGERAHTLFQHSNLFDGYGKNNKVNWILRYGGSEQDLGLSDEEISSAYLGIVLKYFPDARITWKRVFREKYAEPVYDKDYSKNMPCIKCNESENLYFAGTAVTYPKIRNMNSSLESGIEAANAAIADFN
jgi:protoporphyrinogen oxidase